MTIVSEQLADGKKRCDEQWEKLNNFMAIYPDLFNPQRVNKDIFIWATSFLNSRAFGWGLPTTMMVPLADCLNHSTDANLSCDFFEKNLH